MCAFFYDSPTRHHCYDVSSLDSRQPVSDDDAGSSFSRLIQSSLDCLQENRALSGTHSLSSWYLMYICGDVRHEKVYLWKGLPGFMIMLFDGA